MHVILWHIYSLYTSDLSKLLGEGRKGYRGWRKEDSWVMEIQPWGSTLRLCNSAGTQKTANIYLRKGGREGRRKRKGEGA